MRRIAVIGASVSAQATNHATGEATGYCEYLRRNHMQDLGAESLTQICYAGNRLTDGGFVQATGVADLAPDFVILEPNIEDRSRGRWSTPEDVDFVMSTICSTGAQPVLLMLPEEARPDPRVQPGYHMFRDLSRAHDIPLIEYTFPTDQEISHYLRGAHTTPAGGEILAAHLAATLPRLFGDYEANEIVSTAATIPSPLTWSRSAFRADIAVRRLRLRVEGAPGARLSIIQPQNIGPHSPVIEVVSGETRTRTSIWDPYCHYARPSYVRLFDGIVPDDGIIEMSCADEDPAYGECRREVSDWPAVADRHMKPTGDLFAFASSPCRIEILSVG